MSNRWKEFLQAQGAQYSDGSLAHFGKPAARAAARDGNVLVDLSHYSLIRAGGADVRNFLNGQLTNDIESLDEAHTQLSAWCNAKGRVLAVLRILRHADGYLLQLPAALQEDALKRLRMYVLRSKVTLENVDAAWVQMGVAGPDAAAAVRDATGAAPEGENACARGGNVVVLRVPGFHPRFQVLAPAIEAPPLWHRLAERAMPTGADAWTWHDIMAGVPTVMPATSDAFVPQMANLDVLGAISFNKGCYTGQEIVARLHYLGRLKQRMYRAHVVADERPAPGMHLYAPERKDQATGTVVSVCPAPTTGYDLLAVVHTSSVAAGELHVGHPDGPRATIESLPYSVS